jgi:hypothetical protein
LFLPFGQLFKVLEQAQDVNFLARLHFHAGQNDSPLPSAAFCTAATLALALWSVMAIRSIWRSSASCTISGGIISISAQGESTV